MQYIENQMFPGLLMLIDFEIAFDTIWNWNFIHSTLDFFNFEPSIKQWIYTFYNGIKSCVLQNGTSTNCNGHRYRCSPNIPPSLNGSHFLFLLDYKIYIKYIYYK